MSVLFSPSSSIPVKSSMDEPSCASFARSSSSRDKDEVDDVDDGVLVTSTDKFRRLDEIGADIL